jgi:hypothetical protein
MKISPLAASFVLLIACSPFAVAVTPPENPSPERPTPFIPFGESSSITSPSLVDLTVSLPESPSAALPDAPQAQTKDTPVGPVVPPPPSPPKQTKRILFIVPNFRSVTADEKLPPTTTRQKFKLLLDDTFDYSAFAETAVLAGMGEAQGSEKEFHGGWPGYARYYWHSYADLTVGNAMTEFVFPVATHEDPRYYTLGHGGFFRRSYYSVSRLAITRNDQGNPTPNFSEVVGNGAAASISSLYYPSAERTWTKIGQHWVLQLGIDGLSNLLKEFWPEVNRDLFHGKY